MRHLAFLALAGCSFVDAKLAPDTLIDSGPAAITSETSASFAFHGAGGADDFTCVLDNAVHAHCESPFEAPALEPGAHEFTVTAAQGGAIDATPAHVAWRIDTSPPDTSIFVTPPTADNDPVPTFQFTGSDNHSTLAELRFECLIDPVVAPNAWKMCASPLALDIAPLGDGRRTLEVRAIDQAGNVDPTPATYTWDVRLTPPDTSILGGPCGVAAPSFVSFTFQGDTGDAQFHVTLDELATDSGDIFSSSLADGPHTITAAAFDTFGNVDPTPASCSFTVDHLLPDLVFTQVPSNPSSDPMPTFDWFTNNPAPTSYLCIVDGGFVVVPATGTCAPPFTAGPLADGPHTLEIQVFDEWGNFQDVVFEWTIAS